jgi:hypothetical protein
MMKLSARGRHVGSQANTETDMDVVMIALIVASFALLFAYLRVCDRL